MQLVIHRFYLLLILLGLLPFTVACNLAHLTFLPAVRSEPARAVYVLANYISEPSLTTSESTELLIIDANTWAVVGRRKVLPHVAQGFGRDPQGRLWIGYGREIGYVDNRVQVFDPMGQLLATLTVCVDPHTGFHFTRDHAYVGCAENGFSATLAVIDLTSLEVVERREVRGTNYYVLTATGGDEQSFVMLGAGGGALFKIFDLDTLTEPTTVQVHTAAVRFIVPYQGRFYLPNIASYEFPEEAGDLVIVDTNVEPPQVIHQRLPARAPVMGVVLDDQLYLYHNPTHGTPVSEPRRYMSRLDLRTGETQVWQLEDHWNASSMMLLEGRILLSGKSPTQPSGLYEFDPQTGAMTLLVELPGADRRLIAVSSTDLSLYQAISPLQVPSPLSPLPPPAGD